jgi:hypothetical protein
MMDTTKETACLNFHLHRICILKLGMVFWQSVLKNRYLHQFVIDEVNC